MILRAAENHFLTFKCPGCDMRHGIHYIDPANNETDHPRWTWNFDMVSPTFTPSILVRYTKVTATDEEIDEALFNHTDIPHKHMVCHSFITDGKIQFLSDCTHELAGQTVPMVEF
jgi:hypothetical protein